jgi:DNA primase
MEPQRAPDYAISNALMRLVRDVLSLRPEHRERLRARGLTDIQTARARYVSAPATQPERERAAGSLSPYLDAFGGGVPGFYFGRRRWQMAYCPPGFLIPARDECGHIRALALRADDPGADAKYVWLSTNPEALDDRGRQKYPRGASSGAPVHFATCPSLTYSEEVVVTEGTLKADVITALTGLPVVGVAGVNSTRGLADRLRTNLPFLRRVTVAFDKDVFDKPHVADALQRLVAQLEAERFAVRVRTWPGGPKGYDDYLLSRISAREVTAA